MTGHYELNKFVKVALNSLFTQEQIFYMHDFSSSYDILLGRKLLEANQANIVYLNNRTTISGCIFLHKHNSLKNPTQINDFEALLQSKNYTDEINYAVQNELAEEQIYRLEHLNEEEKVKL